MAPDDNSGARPAGPVVLRIKLRYDDLETMVQRFAPNVGKSGLFLPTRSLQPIGTEVKFELRLANDTPVLVGLGRVKHVKPQDPAAPKAAFGMAIELMRVSKEGRELIIKMIERRRAMGLVDVAIPVPEDVDAARRSEAGSQPRGDTSGIVRDAMPNFASAPVAEAVLSPTPPASGPIAVAKAPAPTAEAAPQEPAKAEQAEPADVVQAESATSEQGEPKAERAEAEKAEPVPPPAPLLTSPRDSGPIPTQAVDTSSGRRAVASLAPERAKTKRPRVADLIARAGELSGPVAAAPVDGLDEQVDVARALVRARALAGGDLEAELAALREVAAAPLEISIEAASAELARQLGGKPIAKRSQSAKWIAPPAVEMRTLTDPQGVARVDETAASSSVGAPAVEMRTLADPERMDRVDDAAPSPALETATADAVAAVEVSAVEPTAAEPIAAEAVARVVAEAAVDTIGVEPLTAVEPVVPEAAVEPVAADAAEPVAAEAVAPIATRPPRAERKTAAPSRDRFTRGRNRKAPEPPPAESLEDPPTVIPEGDPDVPSRDPHAAFDAKTRAATEASPSSVLAAVSALPTEPSVPSVPHVEEEPAGASEPEYGFEEKTRIPTGDDLVHALEVRERHSFSNVDEESLRTEPGQRPSSSLMIEDSADAAMLTRAIEGSQPAMRLSDADIEPLDDYGERTQIGQMPAANAFADHGQPTHADNLADQLDRQLAEAEAEADDDFREIEAPQPAYQINPYTNQHQHYVDESQPHQLEVAVADSFVAPAEDPGEEISDFDVLAEADEADADLLSAHGEAEVAHVAVAVAIEPAHDDFAARLDLGDDDPAPALDHRRQQASHKRTKRASSEASYTVAESVPQAAPPFASRPPGDDFDEPHGFANAKPTTPGSLRYSPAAHSEDLEDALAALDVDLEDNALAHQPRRRSAPSQPRPLPGLPAHRPEDTGQTQAARPRPPVVAPVQQPRPPNRPVKGATTPPPIPVGARKTHTTPPPLPVRQPPKRASTDEGVLIDFDDDE